MDHQESEGIKNLLKTINQCKIPNLKRSKKAEDANKLWNASLLFCKIVLEAKSTARFFSREDFEQFTVQFNEQNSTRIETNSLFDKFWLRQVLGFIYIPDAVRVVTNDYEKYKNCKNEVFFLKYLYEIYPNQTMEESDLRGHILEFEEKHHIKISRKWIAETPWIKLSKDKANLKIGNVDYLLTLLNNWDDFRFLYTFKLQTYQRQEQSFKISTIKLIELLDNHRAYFPLTPSLLDFEQNNTLLNLKKEYVFQTTQNEINYWYDLRDEISGHYWETLIQDTSFLSDENRLLKFIDVMLKGSQWPNVEDYILDTSKVRLLEACVSLIQHEPDINDIENEFVKCYLDQQLGSHYGFQSNRPMPNDSLDATDDVFERHKQLQHISSKYQSNIFYVQESRKELAFLVRLVVLMDKEYHTINIDGKSRQVHYHNIKKLLRSGLEKPYLIWETVHFIQQNRPEIIPHLLIETDLCALGFYMLNLTKMEFSNRTAKHILRNQLLEDGLSLLLNSYLRNPNIDKFKRSQLIFQLFLEITKEKSNSVSRVPLAEERLLLLEERQDTEQNLLQIIEDCELNGGFAGGSSNQSLLFYIIDELITLIERYKTKSKHLNGIIELPFIKIDALSWLSKFLHYSDFKFQAEQISKLKARIAETFVATYLSTIEQKKVKKKKIDTAKLIESLPSWPDQNEQLARIDWLSLILIVFETGDLDEFLSPRIKLKKTKELYDKGNNFQADKIRTHLFVLLSILKAIQNQERFLASDFSIEIKNTVEASIVTILKKYGQEKSLHQINILDQRFDRQHFRSAESELLPFIIEIGDLFKNKTALYNQLIDSQNLVQLLYVFSNSQTEGVKESVIHQVRKINISKFMDKQHWLPEITFVVTELSKIPELQKQAAIAFNTWKIITSNRKIERETVKDIFEAQLIQAYYEGNESKIQAIAEPESDYVIRNEFKSSDHKRFFIGLIRYNDKPDEAYEIFDSLTKQYPKYATFALNRFGAKVEVALKNESKEQFKEALKEWFTYEKTCSPSVLKTITEKTNYNKLSVYLSIDDTNAFNELYERLSKVDRLAPDMIKLRVQMLVKYDLINEARLLVNEALSFHSILDQSTFKFLTDLESKISESNPLEYIKKEFQSLKTSSKNSMSSLKPLKYEDDFGKQMAYEIIVASKRFLKNTKLYRPNADEDDYNSFIKEILENKLSSFGFHIEDQSKGGSSASGKKAGERDLVICDDSGDISVIEAFKHSTKTVVQKHITKIFNYSHMRNVFFILAYDLKPSSTFRNRWKYYKSKTLKSIDYPEGFEIDANSIWDATEYFKVKNSAIKVCRTAHKSGTEIYHIMLNVNYFI